GRGVGGRTTLRTNTVPSWRAPTTRTGRPGDPRRVDWDGSSRSQRRAASRAVTHTVLPRGPRRERHALVDGAWREHLPALADSDACARVAFPRARCALP